MKKIVAMLALSLAVAGTINAQNAPQSERSNTYENQKKRDRSERMKKDGFRNKGEERAQFTPEQRASQRTEKISRQLDLSSKQKRQLQALNLKQAQQLEAFRQQDQPIANRKSPQRQEIKSLQADWDKEFKKILSKKQYAQYEQDRKQMQAERGNRMGKENKREGHYRRSSNS